MSNSFIEILILVLFVCLFFRNRDDFTSSMPHHGRQVQVSSSRGTSSGSKRKTAVSSSSAARSTGSGDVLSLPTMDDTGGGHLRTR